ncbi:MAG: O-methyltransferase, partial [Nitriliruptorales bacterium]
PEALAELTALAADEDAAMAAARQRGGRVPAPAPEIGSALAWVAASLDAKTVVGVGDVAGLVGLWVLRGMRPGGMLTTISADAADHEFARHAFQEAGIANRVRAIHGTPEEVLPRLSDGGYDLVVLGPAADGPRQLRDHALRLVRPGGVVAVVDVAHDDDASRRRRLLVRELVEDPRCQVSVLPVDAGLALARFAPGA